MNQWGAVKLGLIVASAGTIGALKLSRAPAAPPVAEASIRGTAAPANRPFDLLSSTRAKGEGALAMSGASGEAALLIEPAPAAPSAPGFAPAAALKKIVKTASLVLEVPDQAKTRALVRGTALRFGAEIQGEESYADGENHSTAITIKVAPEKFDALLKALESSGRVLERTVASENLSEEYVDLKARLENARKVEKRLNQLLAFKTRRLADVLEVERELERVGRDVEQTIGRMKYIDALAASSCVTVRLAEPRRETSQTPGLANDLRNSLTKTFNTFVQTGLALLNLTGFCLAVGLWTAPVAGGLWLLKRRLWS